MKQTQFPCFLNEFFFLGGGEERGIWDILTVLFIDLVHLVETSQGVGNRERFHGYRRRGELKRLL